MLGSDRPTEPQSIPPALTGAIDLSFFRAELPDSRKASVSNSSRVDDLAGRESVDGDHRTRLVCQRETSVICFLFEKEQERRIALSHKCR